MSASTGGGAPRTAVVAAHAKVNLALRILAREDAGFHQLETDFHRLALADDVTVTLVDEPGIVLASDVAFDVPPEKNLAVRAAAAYQAAARWPLGQGIAITIAKRIPMGGGLGGGSADAGAVLRALDALNPHPLGVAARVRIATPLGADVPFLATTAPRVLAWGRGERMLPLAPLPGLAVHLACFETGVNTAHAYGWLAEARAAAPTPPEGVLLDPAALGDLRGVRARAGNAFEPVVAARRDDVRGVLEAWRATLAGTDGFALLSGSGATVFAVTAGSGHGDALAAAATAHGARHVRTTLLERVAAAACRP